MILEKSSINIGSVLVHFGLLSVKQPSAMKYAIKRANSNELLESSPNNDISRDELYASGGNIMLSNAAVVADTVTLYGGSVTIEGKVNGPLKVYAQKIMLNGEVARDVELNAEQIELGPRAKLGGALRYSSNAQFKTAEGVAIGGAATRGMP